MQLLDRLGERRPGGPTSPCTPARPADRPRSVRTRAQISRPALIRLMEDVRDASIYVGPRRARRQAAAAATSGSARTAAGSGRSPRLQPLHRDEPQRRRVHAVAESGRAPGRRRTGGRGASRRPASAPRCGCISSERSSRSRHVVGLERPGEAGPPGARVVLVERAEERLTRDHVHVDPGLLLVPVLVAERRLGPLLLGHLVLQRRERPLELLVISLLLVRHVPPLLRLPGRAAGACRR